MMPLFNAKFGWEDGSHEANYNQGIIVSFGILGMMIGSMTGGRLMTIGRRKV